MRTRSTLRVVVLSLLLLGTGSRSAPLDGYLSKAGLVVLSDGTSGSGFYWNRERRVFFVTARHLLYQTNREVTGSTFQLRGDRALVRSPLTAGLRVTLLNLDLHRLEVDKRTRFHPFHDVAVIEVGTIGTNHTSTFLVLSAGVRDLTASEKNAELIAPAIRNRALKNLVAGTGCFFIGYATSLDTEAYSRSGVESSQPWTRVGRIMTVNYREGTILIGTRVYQGDSGAPVFELGDSPQTIWCGRLIGVVSGYAERRPTGDDDEDDVSGALWNRDYTVVESADYVEELTAESGHLEVR